MFKSARPAVTRQRDLRYTDWSDQVWLPIGNVDIRGALEDEERPREPVDVGNGGSIFVDLWVLLGTADAALRPVAMDRGRSST